MPRHADRKRHIIKNGMRARCGSSLQGKSYLIFSPIKGDKFLDMVRKHNVCEVCVRSMISEQEGRKHAKKTNNT